MTSFHDLTIRKKIILIILLTSTVILIIGFGFVISNEIITSKKELIYISQVKARFIGENCVVYLSFQDRAGAGNILKNVESIPALETVAVYDEKNILFAKYNRINQELFLPAVISGSYSRFYKDHLDIFHPIVYNDQFYGTIYLRVSTIELYHNINKFVLMLLLLLIVLVIILYLIASRLEKIISTPILNLAKATKMISEGEGYLLKVQKKGNDEIGILIDGFNNMMDQIQEKAQERDKALESLRESENKFRALFESDLIGTHFWDATGEITEANDEFLKIVGYTREDLTSGVLRWRDLTPPEYTESDNLKLKELEEKAAVTPFEKEYFHKDGRRVPIILGAATFPGSTVSGVAFILDITERKEAERRIKLFNEELQRSNKELEQFAYVASHDLQEPLRMISSYTQLLERRYGDRLDQDAKDFIGYAVDGAVRMQRLINDLLSYSRVTTRGKPFEEIDSHIILGLAIANLQQAISEAGAIVTNDDLPVIMADESQLVRVFQNIIDNAIKFHGNETPRIHVSAKEDDNEWVFSISDNGLGIDKQFHDRIFVIFQRLHGRDEYPGTGIGLAICKRIIQRQEGKIWFESEVGKGTTFYFTIPKTRRL
ncbi:MAG: PAS domain S-box protein [Candidatus Cloacimonetes bacterium]|nr:PAS domain S-box protein [Candidatus Cloacimonadota bacterium]